MNLQTECVFQKDNIAHYLGTRPGTKFGSLFAYSSQRRPREGRWPLHQRFLANAVYSLFLGPSAHHITRRARYPTMSILPGSKSNLLKILKIHVHEEERINSSLVMFLKVTVPHKAAPFTKSKHKMKNYQARRIHNTTRSITCKSDYTYGLAPWSFNFERTHPPS